MKLHLGHVDHTAMRLACERWHYSGKAPFGKLVSIGVFEDGSYRGAIVFGRGTTNLIGKPWGLEQTEVCELVRVALRSHETPVTRLLSIAFRLLRKNSPGIRMLVSFADGAQGHHGGIYQGGNWTYLGLSEGDAFTIKGRTWHRRSVHQRWGTLSIEWIRENIDPDAERFELPPKHKYAYALDPSLRGALEAMAQPYPKRAGSSVVERPDSIGEVAGSIPSSALVSRETQEAP